MEDRALPTADPLAELLSTVPSDAPDTGTVATAPVANPDTTPPESDTLIPLAPPTPVAVADQPADGTTEPAETEAEYDLVWVTIWAVWYADTSSEAPTDEAGDPAPEPDVVAAPDGEEGSAAPDDETTDGPGTNAPPLVGPPAPAPVPTPTPPVGVGNPLDLLRADDPVAMLRARRFDLLLEITEAKEYHAQAKTDASERRWADHVAKLKKELAEVEAELKKLDIDAVVPGRPARAGDRFALVTRPSRLDPFGELMQQLQPGRGLPLPAPAPAPKPPAAPAPDGGSLLRDFTDAVSIAGIIDPTGVLSLGEAGLEAFQGNWPEAGFAMLGAIPIGGKFVKVARKGDKVADLVKAGDKVGDAAKVGDKAGDVAKIDLSTLTPQQFSDEIGKLIGGVNPPVSGAPRMNCADCAINTDALLHTGQALPAGHRATVVYPGVLAERFGSTFVAYGKNIADVTKAMAALPNGSRGILFLSRGPDNPGHFINVINKGGEIQYWCGQSGRRITDPIKEFSLGGNLDVVAVDLMITARGAKP